ncbi:hypothetical protein OHU25_03280 [Streptomyces sp. NBC_00117]|uniref:hypothetical protein n=1 Tax=unclassified Streptomyces TaxID=2593676 RepID=UPI002E25A830
MASRSRAEERPSLAYLVGEDHAEGPPSRIPGPALAALNDTRPAFDHTSAAARRPLRPGGGRGRVRLRLPQPGPIDVLADLVADLDELQPMFARPQSAATHTRMCHIAGQMAGVTVLDLDLRAATWL